MAWYNFLKSAPKSVDDVFDKDKGLLTQFGGWIGNSQFTSEERAEMSFENAKAVRKFVVDTLAESTDRSRSRRSIAELVIKFFLLVLFMSGMVYPINNEWSTTLFNIATSWTLGGLVSAISIFFFGSHAVAKYQEGKGVDVK
jgi:hypothetical protein